MIPQRLRANAEDAELFCPVCQEPIDRKQRIIFTVSVLHMPVHFTKCRYKYLGALQVWYGLSAYQFGIKMNLSPRVAYRIQAEARLL